MCMLMVKLKFGQNNKTGNYYKNKNQNKLSKKNNSSFYNLFRNEIYFIILIFLMSKLRIGKVKGIFD